MRAALRGSYVEYVYFMGVNERYPDWFTEELYDAIFTDESRYTFWVDRFSRSHDYHEKTLVEDYSVFIRKPNGDIHVTNYDVFQDLYEIFRYDKFTNSGLAALHEDTIDYVEVRGGEIHSGYPDWFENMFVETYNDFVNETTVMELKSDTDEQFKVGFTVNSNSVSVDVDTHCVFLYNKYGEIRGMTWVAFNRHYDPDPAY